MNKQKISLDHSTLVLVRRLFREGMRPYLGKVVVLLIRSRSLTADPVIRDDEASAGAPALDHEQEVLVSPGEWAGKSVIEALIRVAQICLSAGRFLGETSLEATLEKQPALETKAARVDAELARMAPESRH